MTATITAELSLCQGYANCMVEAPDHFDLSDDDNVEILDAHPSATDLPIVRAAVKSCPARALKLLEEA